MNRFLLVLVVLAGFFVGAATTAFAQEKNPSSALAAMDKDKDGKVTLSEWNEIRSRPPMFRRFDANGDGVLDQGELKAMQERYDNADGRRHGRGCMFWN